MCFCGSIYMLEVDAYDNDELPEYFRCNAVEKSTRCDTMRDVVSGRVGG